MKYRIELGIKNMEKRGEKYTFWANFGGVPVHEQ